jgi:glycosyltransferase involved in cell wall biosynthesis
MAPAVSIVIPAKNEAVSLETLLPEIRANIPDSEIIVIDDGSTDATASIAEKHRAVVIRHPASIGNGGAIKAGARAASGAVIVFMDADGQHAAGDIRSLIDAMSPGYDMCVGARSASAQSSAGRRVANWIYNRLASWVVGHQIDDLTSGFRAVNRDKFLQFLHLLPNGFSYPTTITMAFFRAAYPVRYVPLNILPNPGHSHISPWRDGLRFLLIMTRVATLYSPLKIFFPLASASFVAGIGVYLHSYFTVGKFTNMSALLLMTAVLVFLIGLVSEQITTVIYQLASRDMADKTLRKHGKK